MYERNMHKLLGMIKFWQNWYKSEELKTLHCETYKLIHSVWNQDEIHISAGEL